MAFLTKQELPLYLKLPQEPDQLNYGIPQRWDFAEASRFLKIPWGYSQVRNPLNTRKRKIFTMLRKDFAYICKVFPEYLFTLDDETDLINLIFELDVLPELYDYYIERIHNPTPPAKGNRILTVKDQAAYATIGELQGMVRGEQKHTYIRIPTIEAKQAGYAFEAFNQVSEVRQFAYQLRKVHEAFNVPMRIDRRSGHWDLAGNKTSCAYPACYRKEILHILAYGDVPVAAKQQLLESSGTLADIEVLSKEIGLYQWYPYIKLSTAEVTPLD